MLCLDFDPCTLYQCPIKIKLSYVYDMLLVSVQNLYHVLHCFLMEIFLIFYCKASGHKGQQQCPPIEEPPLQTDAITFCRARASI